MQCPRCHNDNVKYLYKLNNQYYCRKCIKYERVFLNEKRVTELKSFKVNHVAYRLDFSLSFAQQRISHQLVINYQNHLNSLVLAVCGSGKTEIVFELISYALSRGDRVCFCVPRKELVKELYERIHESFQDLKIGLLYGGHIENKDAQFIVCTMHQLYRFENQVGFQLMIADEVDAFPFYKNEVLNQIFDRCCLNNYVKMSATFSEEDRNGEELLILNRRYHGYNLPVPKVIFISHPFQRYIVILLLKMIAKKTIIFVPTIKDISVISSQLENTSFQYGVVSSLHQNNQNVISQLKNGEIDCIISTTLLERGVTIDDVQVIVFKGEHMIFDERTLIQIAGRVGRKPAHPNGHVYILTNEKTKSISRCVSTIKKLNEMNV